MSSVFQHPWIAPILNDPEVAGLFGADRQLARYRAFEAAYARALGACGLVDDAVARRAADVVGATAVDAVELGVDAAADGVPIPAYVRRLKAAAGDAGRAVHSGATSQDVMDTALAMTARDLARLLTQRLSQVEDAIAALARRFGEAPIMGRTRMQAASAIQVRDRLDVWARGVSESRARLLGAGAALASVQLGGPVGDGRAFGAKRPAMSARLAADLGLADAPASWHATRLRVVDFGSALALIAGTLGKIGQDVALMAQQGVDEARLAGGGRSSSMPHKANPVDAEMLTTLARYAAAQQGGLHQSMVHEQERSGAAWTLEWLILPDLAQAAGGATLVALRLLANVERLGQE